MCMTVLGILVMANLAYSKGKPSSGSGGAVSVTTHISGMGLYDDPTHFQIQSDGLGNYVDSTDGVVSQLQKGTSIKEIELDTTSSTARTVFLDFRYPTASGTVAPFGDYGLFPTRIVTKCYQDNAITPGTMTGLNSSIDCNVFVRFNTGIGVYGVQIGADTAPQTQKVRITCTAVSGDTADPNAPCVEWTFTPTGDVNPLINNNRANVVNLIHQVPDPHGHSTSWGGDDGDFYFSFYIVVSLN